MSLAVFNGAYKLNGIDLTRAEFPTRVKSVSRSKTLQVIGQFKFEVGFFPPVAVAVNKIIVNYVVENIHTVFSHC